MSLHDYEISRRLEADDVPFEALVMAAMRRADTFNLAALGEAFPRLHSELTERYNAPGGLLDGETSTDGTIKRQGNQVIDTATREPLFAVGD